MRNEMNDL